MVTALSNLNIIDFSLRTCHVTESSIRISSPVAPVFGGTDMIFATLAEMGM
jgi:hypothetical protein